MKTNISLQAVLFEPLVAWYKENKESFPWRKDPTPYRVWISEIMLQQTRIEAVLPYYTRFLEAFPDVRSLANADEERLLKMWQGLGYYSRARNLKKAANQILTEHGGVLPRDAALLRKLAGIGDYTAGAIASIAMGLPEPAVDGNVMRVFMRFTACDDDVKDVRVQKRVRETLRKDYPSGKDAALLTEGLMELGEKVCLPNTAPKCDLCPVKAHCKAYEKGLTEALPVRSGTASRKTEHRMVFVLYADGKYALRKRPAAGLLGGLWELPNELGTMEREAVQAYFADRGVQVKNITALGNAKHVFSHIEWHMTGFLIECDAPFATDSLTWLPPEVIRAEYAVPTAFRSYTKIF